MLFFCIVVKLLKRKKNFVKKKRRRNIGKVKSHDENPRDQKQFYTWTPILYIGDGISWDI